MKRATWIVMALALLLGGVGQAKAGPILEIGGGTPSIFGSGQYSVG